MKGILGHLPALLRKGLLQLIFHVTNRCNAHCDVCLSAADRNRESSSDMDLREIEAMAGQMPAFPWLLLSGGEPFLRKDLADIVSVFSRLNRVQAVSLPTNGLLPGTVHETTRAILTRCPDLWLNLVLSLDGVGEAHDRIRGVEGAFDRVLETFSLLVGLKREHAGLSVKIETVVSAENYRALPDLIEFVRSLEPDRHVCDLARGDLADPCRHLPGPDERETLFPLLQRVDSLYESWTPRDSQPIAMRRLSRGLSRAYWRVAQRTMKEKRRIVPCYAGRASAVVYPDGRLSFCELLPPVADLREVGLSFAEAWGSEGANRARKEISGGGCHCFHPCNQLVNLLASPAQLAMALIRA